MVEIWLLKAGTAGLKMKINDEIPHSSSEAGRQYHLVMKTMILVLPLLGQTMN